jgi:hypothetical protein
MTPEQAVRGIQLFTIMSKKSLEDLDFAEQGYPKLSDWPIYNYGKR